MVNRQGLFGVIGSLIVGLFGYKSIPEHKVSVDLLSNAGLYNTMIQDIKISADLGRTPVFELGRQAPYYNYVNFPTNIKSEIES